MSETSEALEAWREAVRELNATTPWTAEWLRARMIEEDLRLAFHALTSESLEEPAEPDEADVDAGTPVGGA